MTKVFNIFVVCIFLSPATFAKEIKCSVNLLYVDSNNNTSVVFAHKPEDMVTFFSIDKYKISVEMVKNSPWVSIRDAAAGVGAAGKDDSYLETPTGIAQVECL